MKKCTFLILISIALISCSQATKEPNVETVNFENRLKELNIELTVPAAPTANFVKTVRVGNLVYTSGHGPDKADGGRIIGKVGSDLTLEQGQEAAKLCGIALLSSLKAEIGDLNKVKRVVKVLGMVNCDPSFTQQSQVINAFSDLMVQVFGDKGKHARSAVGMSSLPANMAVEIEMIVEVTE